MDLENRQFTLDTVNKKVETILPDLSARDRVEMEQSLQALTSEHQRVYEVALDQKNLLAEAVNARELFHVGLERVELWLQDKEAAVESLDKMKLTATDVEKQAEKARVGSDDDDDDDVVDDDDDDDYDDDDDDDNDDVVENFGD